MVDSVTKNPKRGRGTVFLIRGPIVSDSSLSSRVFAFRDEKFNDIHTKPDDIAAGRVWGSRDLQMSTFFSAQFRQTVLFQPGERNKRERKLGQSDGDVKENILPRPSVTSYSRHRVCWDATNRERRPSYLPALREIPRSSLILPVFFFRPLLHHTLVYTVLLPPTLCKLDSPILPSWFSWMNVHRSNSCFTIRLPGNKWLS